MRHDRSTPLLLLSGAATALLSGCFFADGNCDEIVTECVEVCNTFCDPWGCWDECFTDCQDTCIVYGRPPSTIVVIDQRECTTNAQCSAGFSCNRAGFCERDAPQPSGLCEPCLGHGDCGNGALCLEVDSRADTGFCGRACNRDSDCPTNYDCLPAGNSNQCVPSSRTCSATAPVPECDRNAQCTSGLCQGGRCVDRPNECASDRDCPEPDLCVSGRCEAPLGQCSADRDCPSGEVCTEGLCGPAESECTRDRDCGEGERCLEGACSALPDGTCRTDRDCEDGEVCENRVCTDPPAPETCNFSSECDAGGVCIDGQCRASCTATADCAGGEVCRGGLCAPPPAPQCRTGLDCGDGDAFLCVDGRCRDACDTSADCGAGFLCRAGYCDDDPAVECRRDLECAQGQRCVSGSCAFTCRASCNCPEGLSCDEASSLCVDRPAPATCDNDCDCPSGQTCTEGACA